MIRFLTLESHSLHSLVLAYFIQRYGLKLERVFERKGLHLRLGVRTAIAMVRGEGLEDACGWGLEVRVLRVRVLVH